MSTNLNALTPYSVSGHVQLEVPEAQVQEVDEDNGYILPACLLREVFFHFAFQNEMSVMALTCKVWHDVMVREVCIRQLQQEKSPTPNTFFVCYKRLGGDFDKFSDFDCIFEHCTNLSEFRFYNYIYKHSANSFGGHTQSFLFTEESVTKSIIESAVKHCLKLKTFDFSGMNSWRSPEVSAETLSCLDSSFPNGIHLKKFPFFRVLPRDESQPPIPLFKNLTSLDLSYLGTADDEILFIANHFPNLRELDVKQMERSITDRSIVVLAGKCPLLTHLCIPCSEVTVVSLRALAENCKKLEYFFHMACIDLKSEDLNDLKRQLPQLVTSENYGDWCDQMSQEKMTSRMDARASELQ